MAHRTSRPAGPGQQPMRATVSYQLLARTRLQLRDAQSAGRIRSSQLSSSRRWMMSPDAFTESYLQGHWLKDLEGLSSRYHKDKCTQTPDSWFDKSQSGSKGASRHRRSSSLGGVDHQQFAKLQQQQQQQRSKPVVSEGRDKDSHLGHPQGSSNWGTTQPIPIPRPALATLAPPLCSSIEGLNQELEGMFISLPSHPQQKFLEVPDGRRAPIPLQCSSSGSQCDLNAASSASSSSSPGDVFTPQPHFVDTPQDRNGGSVDSAEMDFQFPLSLHSDSELPPSPPNPSSPEPNNSCCFHRDPPEGCEKVTALEDASPLQQPKPAVISSCPDPNKVNFIPHGVSAFCPVRL